MTGDETRLWKWVELPRFARFCQEIAEALNIPYEDDIDKIRWAIEETVLKDPHSVSHPDPRFQDDARRYFHTADAPAQLRLPPLVVIFRIASYPKFGEPGLIEGREVWIEDELRQIGFTMPGGAAAA